MRIFLKRIWQYSATVRYMAANGVGAGTPLLTRCISTGAFALKRPAGTWRRTLKRWRRPGRQSPRLFPTRSLAQQMRSSSLIDDSLPAGRCVA